MTWRLPHVNYKEKTMVKLWSFKILAMQPQMSIKPCYITTLLYLQKQSNYD